jgi:hypothetical protein
VEDQLFGTCRLRICTPDKANDGRADTRWGSAFADDQFWQVDLGAARLVDTVTVDWQTAYPLRYRLSVSLDGVSFSPVEVVQLPRNLGRNHIVVSTSFAPLAARFVRITGVRRATEWGFSIWTVNVQGPPDPAGAPAPPPAGTPPAPAPPPPGAPSAPGAPGSGPSPSPAPPSGDDSPSSALNAPAPPAGSPALRPIAASTLVRLTGRVSGSRSRILRLSVRAPRRATVRVRCTGRGCPSRVRSRRGSGSFKELKRTLRAGAVLEVFVTQAGTFGKYTRFTIRSGAPPRRADRCVLQGTRAPVVCPED